MPVGHVVHRLARHLGPPGADWEPWIHAVPVSGGVGRSRRNRGPAIGRSLAHDRDSGGTNGPTCPNGGSVCSGNGRTNNVSTYNGSTHNNAAHRHRRACRSSHPRCVSPGFRLAVDPSTGGPSSVRTAQNPVVIRAPRRRPIGNCRPGGGQRGRRRRVLLRRDRGPRGHHREAFRWAAHDLRTGRPTAGIRDDRASGRSDRDDLLRSRTLCTDHLPALGRHRRAALPRSPVAVGPGPPHPAAARLRWSRCVVDGLTRCRAEPIPD